MIKTGNIEIGRTPSVVSGQPSKTVKDGEPVAANENAVDPGLVKLAASLEDTVNVD